MGLTDLIVWFAFDFLGSLVSFGLAVLLELAVFVDNTL